MNGTGLSKRYYREYISWSAMKQRCFYKKHKNYNLYGGRGITVCDGWLLFKNFLADLGPKPSPKHTVDRVDKNGNYELGNCRWATMKEQNNNRRDNALLTYNGETKTYYEWADIVGIRAKTIKRRIRVSGYSVEKALSNFDYRYYNKK